MLNRNIGTVDRVLRLVVGAALLALVFVGPKTPWGWSGAVLIVTALFNFCPLYRIFGIRTCRHCGTGPR